MIPETSYGHRKRLEFVDSLVSASAARAVLDVGCGTGAGLLGPLAAAHASIRFVGVDDHEPTLRAARELNPGANLAFCLPQDMPPGPYDIVIASEVLEHVEDPPAFLAGLLDRLAEKGRLVVTVPNGYGPFEWASWVETVFVITRLYDLLGAVMRALLGAGRPLAAAPDTHAVSPHINFFSWGALHEVFAAAGAEVVEYRARTFLCGFGFDSLLRSERARAWNASGADRRPAGLASDWMFILAKAPKRPGRYRRGAYARFRRWLNEKRWGLR
jgi:SAM-dependent methyltransferase